MKVKKLTIRFYGCESDDDVRHYRKILRWKGALVLGEFERWVADDVPGTYEFKIAIPQEHAVEFFRDFRKTNAYKASSLY